MDEEVRDDYVTRDVVVEISIETFSRYFAVKDVGGSMLVDNQTCWKTAPIIILISSWSLIQLPPLMFVRETASPFWLTTA